MALSKDRSTYEIVVGRVTPANWRGDIYALQSGRPSAIVLFSSGKTYKMRVTGHAVAKFYENGEPSYRAIMTFAKEITDGVHDLITLEDFSKAFEYGSNIRILRLGMNNNRMLNSGLPVDRKSGVTYYQVVMRPVVEHGGVKVLEIFSIKKHRGKESSETDDNPLHYRSFSVDNQTPKKSSPPPRPGSESGPVGHIHQPPPPPLYDSMTGHLLARFDPMTGQPLGVPVAAPGAAGPAYSSYRGYQATWGAPPPPDTPASPEGRDGGRKRSWSPSDPRSSRSVRQCAEGYYYDNTGNL